VVAGGVTVGEPPVGLVLPAPPTGDLLAGGITVGEPPVGLVLPFPPTGDLGAGGITLSEPVIFVRLDVPPSSPGPTGAANLAGSDGSGGVLLRLQSLRVDPAPANPVRHGAKAVDSWWITLEWRGPADARFVVESSGDLIGWQAESVELIAASNGQFFGRCWSPENRALFYRVRLLP
jgi:hypothetical protein